MNKFSINAISSLDKYTNIEYMQDSVVRYLRNMLLEGGKAKVRGGIDLMRANSAFRPLKLIDNGVYLYGASDTEFKKSLNGLSDWTDIAGATITSSKIISDKFIDKLICVNGKDKSFAIKTDIASSLVVDRPDVSSVSATKITNSAVAKEALKDILIYKAVPCGGSLYGVSLAGSKIYKFDVDSNLVAESEDVFTAICSICTSYDGASLYVLDSSGTTYSLHKVSPSTMEVEKTWFISLTPFYALSDIHATENKIWVGAGGIYATRQIYTDAIAIWNFDIPDTATNNIVPTDSNPCMSYGNVVGKWEIESIIFIPKKMFSNGWDSTIISVLMRAYVTGGATYNSVRLPHATNKQQITTGIYLLSEAYEAYGGNTAFDGITQDIIPVTVNNADTQWDGNQMQIVYDATIKLTYIMFDRTLLQAFGRDMSAIDGCINYSALNSGNIAPYYDTYSIETADLTPYFQVSTIAYSGSKLYILNTLEQGGTGVAPVTFADPIQLNEVNYGLYLLGGVNDYYYAVVYITADGETSAPSHILVFSSGVLGEAYSITLKDIPVSADARTVKKKIYRSTKDGIALYEIAELDNATTEYEDKIPDTELDTSTQLDETIDNFIANTCIFHKDRMFYGNIKGQRNSITSSLLAGEGAPAIALMTSSGVGLEIGTYLYKFELIDQNGYPSPLGYPFSVYTEAGLQKVAVYLTKPVSRFDYNLVKYRIYRTKVNGSSYYYVGEQTLGLVYIDSTADASLIVPYSEPLLESRVMWSTLDNAGTISASDYTDIYPDDNDAIVGFADDVEGVIIFKQKSIYKLYTTGLPQGWTLRKIGEGNCDSSNIQSYANKHYYIYNDKIYRNDSPTVSLSRIIESDFTTIKDIVYYEKEHWLVVVMKDYVYVYNEVSNYWARIDITNCDFNCAGIYKGNLVFSLDRVADYCIAKYNADSSADNITNPQTIITEIHSKGYIATKPTEYFRLRKLLSNYKKADDVDVQLTIYDLDSAGTLVYTDSANSVNSTSYKNLNLVIENMTGTIRLSNKIQIRILNAREIGNIDLMFTTLHRNLR